MSCFANAQNDAAEIEVLFGESNKLYLWCGGWRVIFIQINTFFLICLSPKTLVTTTKKSL